MEGCDYERAFAADARAFFDDNWPFGCYGKVSLNISSLLRTSSHILTFSNELRESRRIHQQNTELLNRIAAQQRLNRVQYPEANLLVPTPVSLVNVARSV